MRKNCFLIILIGILIAGCSNQHQTKEKQIKTTEPINKSEEASNHDAEDYDEDKSDNTNRNVTDNTKKDTLEGQIKEQSFDVTLDGWGEVTFASFMPIETDEMNQDVRFKLLKGNDEIYNFPGLTEDNTHFNQYFEAVAAVAFKDYNEDGKKDIIIISKYAPLQGPNVEEGYNEVRLYTQLRGKKEFLIEPNHYLDEFLMKNDYNDSIDSVMEGIEEYHEMFASYYGDFRVTACKGTTDIYALTDEEIEDRIGTTLSYQTGIFIRNGNIIVDLTQNEFSEKSYSTDDLSKDFRVNINDLGITEKEILAVTVEVDGDLFGTNFYVLDENTLLIYYEGVFFEADREVK